MTPTPRDIEKLRAIGYDVQMDGNSPGFARILRPDQPFYFGAILNHEAWADQRRHADNNLEATMADKIRFICGDSGHVIIDHNQITGVPDRGWFISLARYNSTDSGKVATAPTLEEAVDALFWGVQ